MIRDTSSTDTVLDTTARRRHLIRWVCVAGVAVILILLATIGFGRWAAAERSVSAESLRFAMVERGDLQRELNASGRVVAAVRPMLYAPATGRIRLHVRAGDQVEVDQMLAIVNSPEMESRLEQERATLESLQVAVERERIELRKRALEYQKAVGLAQVTLDAAEREMRRSEASMERNLISDFDFQEARDNLNKARLDHAHAQADAELAGEALQFELETRQLELRRQQALVAELERQVDALAVISPVAGIVGNLEVDDRQMVVENQPLISVVDLSALEIEVDVPESHADDLNLGTPARIRIGNQEHEGQVVSVSPEIENGLARTRLRFDGEPPGGLRQNQRVSAQLLLDHRPGVLKVRRGAFVDSGGGRIAYVRQGRELVRRTIQSTAGSLSELEILDGLEEGEVIVTSNLERFGQAERVLLN
jgi:HlyD family secretion protein